MRIRSAGAAVLLVGLMLFTGLISAGSWDATASVATHPCAAETRVCDGRLDVPLDWRSPSGERISVAFRWFPRTDQSRPAAGTVLVIPGGPTAALPLAEWYRRMLGPALERRNMLVVDPRGLGESSPLTCAGIDLGARSGIGECGRRLGDRVQWFSSDQAAADLDAVRAALGVPELTVYGGSYGTLWAQAYAARFPARVRAMLLHDVVRTGRDGYVSWPLGGAVRAGQANLETVCRHSAACRAIPGNPARNWATLIGSLRTEPDPLLPVPTLVRLPLFNTPATSRELNAAVAAYLRGDRVPLHRLARYLAPAQSADSGVAPGYFAYVCADSAHPYARSASPDQRRRQLDAAYARENPFVPFTVAQIRETRSDDLTHEDCLDWPTPRHSPPVPRDAPRLTVPVLAVGGTFDATTPLADAVAVAGRYPRGRVAENRFGGHSPELVADTIGLTGRYWLCARDTVRSFITHPTRRQRGCDAENYRAVGSFPTTAAELPSPRPGLGGVGPVVAAAYTTVADAIARRNPYVVHTALSSDEPGLRGGKVTLPDQRTARLRGVRFVSDVTVDGGVRVDDRGVATAEVTAAGHDLTLTWTAFGTDDSAELTGSVDGRPFRTRLPRY